MKNPIKIGIVGAGNVGRTLSVMLSANGYYVEAVTGKSPHNIQIDNYTAYEITGDFGNKQYLVRVIADIVDLSKDLDIIFVCTKIFDAVPMLKVLREKIKPTGAIVTIQNMFWIDRVASLVDPNNMVCMYLDFSCKTVGKKTYVKNSDGIKLGVVRKEAFDKLEMVHDVLSNVCRVKDTNDIVGITLGRNIINISISSLGAISGLKLKDILLDRNGRYLFVKIIEEEMSLLNLMNIKVMPYDGKLDYYKFLKNDIPGKLYKRKIMRLLIKNNGNIVSSALRDFEFGRKSELLVVLNNFIKYSSFRGLKVPYIREIYDMLCQISKNERRISEDAFYDKKLVKIGEKKW